MQQSYKKRILDLDIYGDKYEIKFPTGRMLSDYLQKLKQLQNGEIESSDYDLTKELLSKLGLPEQAAEEMELEHLNDLSKILLGQKKI